MGFAELVILIGTGILFTGAIFWGVYSDIKKNKKIKQDAQRRNIKQAQKITTDNLPKKALEKEDVKLSDFDSIIKEGLRRKAQNEEAKYTNPSSLAEHINKDLKIKEYNEESNKFRDIVKRMLEEKGLIYTPNDADELLTKIYQGFGVRYMETVGFLTTYHSFLFDDRLQRVLECPEYEIIANINGEKVKIILSVFDEIHDIMMENFYKYKIINNYDNNRDWVESELDRLEIEDEETGIEIIKEIHFIHDRFNNWDKYVNVLFWNNTEFDDKPYKIHKKIGLDKITINPTFIWYANTYRDEILEVFYSRASKGVTIQDKAREAHTYIIGASKSGKSELIKDLIFTDFQRGNKSVILIEPHGDLSEQVAKLKGKDNKNLVYIDFTLDPEKTPVLNPFDISDRSPENIEIQAQALIDAFEDILGAEFSTQMEELLGATIRTLMMTGKGDFWELRRFMDDENNSDLITAGKASPNPKDRLFFNDGSFNQQSYKPTKNSLKSKIGTYLGYAVFRNFTTGKSTIDLKKLTDGKKWVIFNLSKGNIGKKVSPILGRFVIASLQNIILQRAKTTHRTPVYLYIDEFQNYTSETIEEIFSESRKYGFHLTVAHQNTGQLLGKMKDLIFSNTSVKIVGRNDTEQLKKLSNQILTEFEELDKLTTGNFYMRVEKNEAQKIKVGTKLIDNKYSMTPQEWEQVKAEQLDEFYTKIEQREPPTISEPESEKFDFNPSDTV